MVEHVMIIWKVNLTRLYDYYHESLRKPIRALPLHKPGADSYTLFDPATNSAFAPRELYADHDDDDDDESYNPAPAGVMFPFFFFSRRTVFAASI